ncbi:hypothetical protein FA13DRAFT_1506827 [Coprinellus micaceus]|uniref:Uncharacterized protein n=1 Tax=Coprinellus micaceus TaxID=71717 RepID=A0A4Y7TMP4_COPMI|nr:hypothetical protein FA13DRAFT_1506827 [Coprinellus micaceus]
MSTLSTTATGKTPLMLTGPPLRAWCPRTMEKGKRSREESSCEGDHGVAPTPKSWFASFRYGGAATKTKDRFLPSAWGTSPALLFLAVDGVIVVLHRNERLDDRERCIIRHRCFHFAVGGTHTVSSRLTLEHVDIVEPQTLDTLFDGIEDMLDPGTLVRGP